MEAFSVDENGRILSQKRFDREQQAQYHFTLEAVDDSGKGLASSLNITVNIVDINDNPPKFSKNFYMVAVNEETDSCFTVTVSTYTIFLITKFLKMLNKCLQKFIISYRLCEDEKSLSICIILFYRQQIQTKAKMAK